MASIREVRPGVFRIRVRVKDPATGQWGISSQTVEGTKRDAQKAGREMESAKDKGLLRAGRTPTVAAFAELWLAGVKHSVAYESYRGYSVNVHRHIVPFLGELRLKDLSTAHVHAFLGHLLEQGLSPSTVQYVRAVLRMVLERAVDDGLMPRNVVSKVKSPKIERREMLTLDEPQARLLIEQAAETRLTAPVVLGLMCGLRRGEICGLRWRDLDLEREEASVVQTLQRQTGEGLVVQPTKSSGSQRSVSLPPSAVAHLRKWRGRQREERLAAGPAWRGGDHVCTTPTGGPLDPCGLSKSFRRLADSLDLPPVRFHDLRHTYAHLSRRAGVDFKLIQRALGHATAAFTLDVYGHIGAGELKEAAATIDRALWG
ncbi:MAG: site-specific integrase [Bacillota bacterium]|nr:site-specific integrase [Bacillota bacterium]